MVDLDNAERPLRTHGSSAKRNFNEIGEYYETTTSDRGFGPRGYGPYTFKPYPIWEWTADKYERKRV
jgi:hypothetical protein